MIDETSGAPKSDSARVDASRGAIARKINRLPPGEHFVELRAKAVPDHMGLQIAAYSVELQAGTVLALDKIFGSRPAGADAKDTRAYDAQGSFWFGLLAACGIGDEELQDISLEELATKITGKQVVATINDAGYWSRVRPI